MRSRTSRTRQGPRSPAAQRAAIAAFVDEYDLVLVEDDPYGELRYSEVDTTPIAASDHAGRVLHLGSFSKVLSPALRTAWIAGPPALVAKCELAKQAADLCSPSLDQWIVSEFVNAGLLEPQIGRAREHYRGRRATLLAALETELPPGCRFTRSEGGLFSFVELPAGCGIDTAALLETSLAEDKVAFIPGAPFFVEGDGSRTLRLTFAKENDERIREGIGRLGRRVRTLMEAVPA
jgi:2-aminoadipate transaminase